jgi:spore coat polysaccharide biosynthesis predicted glycosyltransferase SpsG
MPKSFVFRVDKSPQMGMGHFMRCRALAEAIVEHGGQIAAVCYRGDVELV